MKKSIIVIALALLMLVPVFADTTTGSTTPATATTNNKTSLSNGELPLSNSIAKGNNTTKTEVGVTLKLNPIYYTAITDIDVTTSPNVIDRTNYSNEKYNNTDKITMDIDDENWVLNEKSGYYLSYFFYQNTQDVTLNVKIDQDLTTTSTGTTADGKTAKTTIQYKATFKTGTNATVVIHSNTANGVTNYDIAKRSGSNMVDNSISNSFSMTLAPEADQNIKNNVGGYYTSTITLTLKNS